MKTLVVLACALCLSTLAQARELRVCADPNNLPFSNEKSQGFENKIVDLIAKDMNAHVTYVWWAQRRGYVRHTLYDAQCDLWPGVASQQELLSPTQPYYRSTYVFVTRADRHLAIQSLNDPKLRQLKIGVEMVGYDADNTPPAMALARRGITRNVKGYSVLGDYRLPNPPAAIIDAVAKGDVDVAIAWGPLAGYFAAKAPVSLNVTPVTPERDARLPMTFAISMGVRRGDVALVRDVDQALLRNKSAIDAALAAYHVPLLATYPGPTAINAQ
ncbi:MAG TPA: substrate-binding domain-containing protein [Methylovirgula sp.]